MENCESHRAGQSQSKTTVSHPISVYSIQHHNVLSFKDIKEESCTINVNLVKHELCVIVTSSKSWRMRQLNKCPLLLTAADCKANVYIFLSARFMQRWPLQFGLVGNGRFSNLSTFPILVSIIIIIRIYNYIIFFYNYIKTIF